MDKFEEKINALTEELRKIHQESLSERCNIKGSEYLEELRDLAQEMYGVWDYCANEAHDSFVANDSDSWQHSGCSF